VGACPPSHVSRRGISDGLNILCDIYTQGKVVVWRYAIVVVVKGGVGNEGVNVESGCLFVYEETATNPTLLSLSFGVRCRVPRSRRL
jgi:hypothetical protein